MAQATSPALGAPEDIEPPDEAVIEGQTSMMNDPDEGQYGDTPGWLTLLQSDTPDEEVHKRPLMRKGGQVMREGQPVFLDYVTARFVMDRLDAAVGPINWSTVYESLQSGAVRCHLSIRPPGSDEWITKSDVGIPSSIEPDKGAHSDSLKRAAVQWGIARDLYDERDEDRPVEQQVEQAQQVSPIKQQVQGNGAQVQDVGQQPQWACPIHDDMKIVPAGISKRTGKAYSAFYACPVGGCDEKGPSLKG